MPNKIIIHISDLHVSRHVDRNGDVQKRIGSYLTTQAEPSENESYIDQFCKFLQYKFKDAEKILFISGDISDQGYPEEFAAADVALARICEKLSIDKTNIVMVPGDHDINRLAVETAYRNSDKKKKAYLMNDVKYNEYGTFYKSFIGEVFDPAKVICRILAMEEEKLLIVGLNSNGKVGAESANGFIDHQLLKMELDDIIKDYRDYTHVAVFHHNLEGQYEDSLSGQWDAKNKVDIIQIFEEYKFNAVFYGNEHTPASNTRNQLSYISATSFAKNNVSPGFRVYEINSDDGALRLKNRRYNLINDGAKTGKSFGNWSETDFLGGNENLQDIVLRDPLPKEPIQPAVDLFGIVDSKIVNEAVVPEQEVESAENVVTHGEKYERPTAQPQIDFSPNVYHDKIFKIVKENKYFVSGHFHWSDSSKAHNWINVPLFLSDRENLSLAQKAIFDVVQRNTLQFDFILGLGIEGNILATYTASRTGKRYSYLPYSYRYQDHAVYEKDLHIENVGEFKRILVITDVINNGKTVERLIEAEKGFFKEDIIESIDVVSLFYTGDPIANPLNQNTDTRVQNYFVSHMKVEKCPYGNDFRETCMIYREKLDCVHEFYDAGKSSQSSK